MPYTPFDKPLQAKLTTDDLKKLIEQKVTEGYYIEFKSDFPGNQKIGHSVASFANTYGGWYIVGIKTNEHNVATEICGFDLSLNRNPISKVREVIKSHIDPIPIFYPQLIPLENNDRGVLVIYIPDNQETPFVTKDGRIYRRVNDSSDPVPEKHRNAIDRLVENGRDIKKQFERFCTDNRGFSKAETEGGWIKIFVSPYPLGLIDKFEEFLDDDLENFLVLSKDQLHIMKIHSDPVTGNIPFNSCQPTHCSVILRQTTPSLAAYNSLSMELFIDGRAKFFIPIQYLSDFKKMVLNQIESQEVKELLWSIWREDKEMHTDHLHFFDIAQLWLVIACLFTYYFEWLKHEPLLDELKISIIADGVWRSVPFFDDDKWAEHIKKFGLPVMLNKSVQIPSDIGHGFTIRKQNTKDDVPEWMFVICLIGLAFGLPKETFAGSFGSAIAKASKKKTNQLIGSGTELDSEG